jgi:hypothetical protein
MTRRKLFCALLEQPSGMRVQRGMELATDTKMTDTQTKLRIGLALNDRLAPIACAIVQNITTSIKLIDDLPSPAIEALLDYSRERHRADQPKTGLDRAYKDVRAALLKYGEVALHEARERERRLLSGITGLE